LVFYYRWISICLQIVAPPEGPQLIRIRDNCHRCKFVLHITCSLINLETSRVSRLVFTAMGQEFFNPYVNTEKSIFM
jgi:hypothetical protein